MLKNAFGTKLTPYSSFFGTHSASLVPILLISVPILLILAPFIYSVAILPLSLSLTIDELRKSHEAGKIVSQNAISLIYLVI